MNNDITTALIRQTSIVLAVINLEYQLFLQGISIDKIKEVIVK